MKRIVLLIAIAAAIGVDAAGQAKRSSTPVPAQTPAPNAAATPTPTPEDDVVKITTSLIQIDVTITDSRGRPIADIRPDEIEIYENGKKQTITNFSFVSNIRSADTVKKDKQDRDNKNEPLLPPTGPIRPDDVRRTVALIVDDLTLSFESVSHTRRALRRFVDEQMQDGDLVAIIRTGAGIGALQQFTSDKRILHKAIEKVKWNSYGSGGIGAFAPLEGIDPGDEEEEEDAGVRTKEGRRQEMDDLRASYFATGTLGAVGYVIRGMEELPGRKSVMLFSDGFTLYNRTATGGFETSPLLSRLNRLIDQANRSSVVIYTLDPRGLQVLGLTAADSTAGMSMQQVLRSMSDRGRRLRDTQDGLTLLAKETGGFAMINSNDLSKGINRVLDDQSYYLVAYEPDEETFDAAKRRFNRFDVKVLRKGARVRYRSGFFGMTNEDVAKTSGPAAGDMLHALASPFASNDVDVRLNALFGVTKDRTSFIRSLLHVSAGDLTFEDGPDGKKIAKFNILALSFGDNGVPVDRLSKIYTVSVTPEGYNEFLKNGFVYEFAFPVNKPGAYQMRVALRDNATNRVGSASQYVEVPNLKKKRLTLSGVAVENISLATVARREKAPTGAASQPDSDPLMDNAVLKFKRESVINFGLTVMNVKPTASLRSQLMLFRDGKEIYRGEQRPVDSAAGDGTANYLGSIVIPAEMELGDYILRIDITDSNGKGKKYATATQFLSFEIVEGRLSSGR